MTDIIEIDSTGSVDHYTEPVVIEPIEENTVHIVENQDLPESEFSDNSDVVVLDQKEPSDNLNETLIKEDSTNNISNDEIINVLKEINENVQKGATVSGNDISDSVNDSVIIVSQNEIMTKNLNDYTVSESLSLMIFLTFLCTGLVFIIRKGLYKWT